MGLGGLDPPPLTSAVGLNPHPPHKTIPGCSYVRLVLCACSTQTPGLVVTGRVELPLHAIDARGVRVEAGGRVTADEQEHGARVVDAIDVQSVQWPPCIASWARLLATNSSLPQKN